MKKIIFLIGLAFQLSGLTYVNAQNEKDLSALAVEAEHSLEVGISFMQSLAIEGGYVYHYRWMEKKNGERERQMIVR